MGKIFYWWSLSSDYTLGPLVTLLSLQEKIIISNETVHSWLLRAQNEFYGCL